MSYKKVMPELKIYEIMEDASLYGIEVEKIPRVANEIAAVLVKEEFELRSSALALSHVLGWLACQLAKQGSDPEAFMAAIAKQSLNYCRAFSGQLNNQ
jgi:hypothetical protein